MPEESPSPLPPGFRERLLRNTLYGIGGRVAGLVVALLLTPYVVHRLGAERYALYALASTVTGYLALLDLGLGTGYVKYLAEAAAHEDRERMNEVLSTGFYAYLGFGALLLALWWPVRHALVRAIGVDDRHHDLAVAAFTLAVGILALSGAAAAFRAVLYGLQKIDVATRIGVALILPRVALVVGALELGSGLLGLVAADAFLFLLGTAALAWTARLAFPELSLRPSRVTRGSLRQLFGYGTKLQVSRLSEMVNFHFDKLLLARFVGLASVTDYDLAAKVLQTARSFPLLLVNAVVPAVSDLQARGHGAGVERLAARALRYLLVAATPLFAFLAVEASPLMAVWLGPGHEASATALRILSAGYLLNVASGAFTSVTQGIARNDYQMKLALLGLTVNIALSLALVRALGFEGVVLGTTLALGLAYLYAARAFRALAREALGGSGSVPARTYLAPLLGAVVAGLGALAVRPLLAWPGTRAWQAAALGASACLFALLYGGALLAAGGLDAGDRRTAREALVALASRARSLGMPRA